MAELGSDDASDDGEVDDLVELVSSLVTSKQTPGNVSGPQNWTSWAENWNGIVASWWVAAMILVPTLVGAYCGYRFAFSQAGPVFFQSVVSAVIPLKSCSLIVGTSFAKQQYGSTARKRFTEDIVEVVSKMGHDLDWEVELELQFSDGKLKMVRQRMTAVDQRAGRLRHTG